MKINLYQKSSELLEKIANSIMDREKDNQKPFFFNAAEVHVTKEWLNDFIKQVENEILGVNE